MASTPTVSPAATSAATPATNATNASYPEAPGVKWLPQKTGGTYQVEILGSGRKRPRIHPSDYGGSVQAAFEAACAMRLASEAAPREEVEVKYDEATCDVIVSKCAHNTCTRRNISASEFAPNPHNNNLRDFAKYRKHYYIAVDPGSSGKREEAIGIMKKSITKQCFKCLAHRNRSRVEGTSKEAQFNQMVVKIREDLKTKKCVNVKCQRSGKEVPLECDHMTGTKTADVLDAKGWLEASRKLGMTPQDMWNEYTKHTQPLCKCCHLLRDNHAGALAAARDGEGDRPRTKEKTAIERAWKRERRECFYCKRKVAEGQEVMFHWMHKKKLMVDDPIAAGEDPLEKFNIGSSKAQRCELVKTWKARTEKEIAKCELGCANCHEMCETRPEREALKDALANFVEEAADMRKRRAAANV